MDQKSEHTPSRDSSALQNMDESMPPTVSLSLEGGSVARPVNEQGSQHQTEQDGIKNANNAPKFVQPEPEEPQQSKSYTYEEVSEPEPENEKDAENERARSQTTGNVTMSFAVDNYDPSTPSLLPTARPATLLPNPAASQLGAAQSALDTQDFYASPPREHKIEKLQNETSQNDEFQAERANPPLKTSNFQVSQNRTVAGAPSRGRADSEPRGLQRKSTIEDMSMSECQTRGPSAKIERADYVDDLGLEDDGSRVLGASGAGHASERENEHENGDEDAVRALLRAQGREDELEFFGLDGNGVESR